MNDNAFKVHQNHFIEEIATVLEGEGLPRMVGRVFGYLLICQPRTQTSAELAEALHASRGAISTATRTLSQTGLVRRTRKPGSRATYFEVPDDAVDHLMNGALARLMILGSIIDNGLALLKQKPERDPTRLQSFRAAFRFMGQEFPALLARWDAQKEES